MDSLKLKQDYYAYTNSNWSYKLPPSLDPSLQESLTKLGGQDEYGDPLYLFLWCGVATVRKHEADKSATILGDPLGCRISPVMFTKEGLIIPPRLQPRYIYVRARQLDYLCYKDSEGQVHTVERRDQIPKGSFSWAVYKYVDYGQLYWRLMRKLTPEQLVQARVYLPSDPNLPRRGDYISICKIHDSGHYAEPTQEWLSIAGRYIEECETERPSDLKTRDVETRDKLDAQRAQKEEQKETGQLNEMIRRVTEDHLKFRTYSI